MADAGNDNEDPDSSATEGEPVSRPASDPLVSWASRLVLADPSWARLQETIARALAPSIGSLESISSRAIQAQFAGMESAALRNFIGNLNSWRSLSRASDYKSPDESSGAYSPQMDSPSRYFERDETSIASVDDLHSAITTLISKTPDLTMVWRGVRSSEWGLHSQLYRQLMKANGVVPPSKKPKKQQPYPDEDQMVIAERAILRIARSDWRFDAMSALETFARIQHAGGPTRLIDVTKNPYIGAWFAVEADPETDHEDARLFALATTPVFKVGKPDPADASLQLDEVGGTRDPFWHYLATPADRQALDWGTGSRRRVWIPPAYDPRISAQNAAFVLDGVPITSKKTAPYFTIEPNVYWRRADLLAASSIYAKIQPSTRKPRYNARNFAPTFSFRIEAAAKPLIRDYMESRFGYRLSYIYPDMTALAAHLKTINLTTSE